MVNFVDAFCARLGFNESNLVVHLLHFEKDKRISVLPDHVVIKNDLEPGHSRLNHQRVEVQQVWEHGFHKQAGSISWYIGAPIPTSWLVDFGISSSANDDVVKLSELMKNVRLTFDPGGNSIGLEYMIGCMILSHCVNKSKANLNVAFQLFIELNREEYMNQEEGTSRAAKVIRELRNAFG
ncbi:hypothetical protein KY285_001207 [Solanum tuberosum]|nr:hypothetical protein KY285_001207 [Solanum tuberosum]